MWVDGIGTVPGRLIVISGPSGSGKSTLIRALRQRGSVRSRVSVSATTRPPRVGERPGEDYHFTTREGFLAGRDGGRFLEWAEYNGQLYGTPRDPVMEGLIEGWNVLLEIEVQGAAQVRELVPCGLFVFIKAPSFSIMARRLVERGTETPESLQRRLVRARHELAEAHWYDHVIINDEVERAVGELELVLKQGD